MFTKFLPPQFTNTRFYIFLFLSLVRQAYFLVENHLDLFKDHGAFLKSAQLDIYTNNIRSVNQCVTSVHIFTRSFWVTRTRGKVVKKPLSWDDSQDLLSRLLS